MFPHGIIYKFGDPPFGVKWVKAPLRVRIAYQSLRGVGAGIIAYAIIFFMFTYGPVIKEEISYRLGQKTQATTALNLQDLAKAKTTVEVQEEAETLGINSYFSVFIPKIDAKANIIANVDASDEGSYTEALAEGIAHARGTYFPGQGKRVYLFSHSTDSPLNFARYNAVFYLLGKLEKGDQITVFFADKKYTYQVTDKQTVAATDTEWLVGGSNEEELVLQTCDPPGTTWRRLVVVAKPISIDNIYGGK